MSTEPYADASYISVETFRKNGRGVKTPVWCAPCGDEIAIFTERTAGKVRGEWCEGVGRIVESAEEEARAYEALHEKYGWQMAITDFFSRLTGRIDGRAVVLLRLDDPA